MKKLFLFVILLLPVYSFSQQIAAGYAHSMAICNNSSGTVRAWGDNQFGQLGNGTNTGQHTPVQLDCINNVNAIAGAMGGNHSLMLKNDGTVWSSGWNFAGQLGDGTTTDRNTFSQVNGLTGIIAISCGASHSFALKSDGTVWAWGRNSNGQLGDGTTIDKAAPVQVIGLTDIIAISGNGAEAIHSLALKADGTVWSWGTNTHGELGDGTYDERYVPGQVNGLAGIIDISGGESHSLALQNDGTAWAWGQNFFGQLGNDTVSNSNVPLHLSNLSGITAVAGGHYHSLALKNDGTVWAWGFNEFGQLGDGTVINSSTPLQISNLSNITEIVGGGFHSLALKNDGSIWAWGNNSWGQLGDGTTNNSSVPVHVIGSCGAYFCSAPSCENAIDLGRGDTLLDNFNITDSLLWISFIADSSNIAISTYLPSNTPSANITRLRIYNGTCNNLNLFADYFYGDSIYTNVNLLNLTPGNRYYLQFFTTPVCNGCNSFISFSINNYTERLPLPCPTTPSCNLIGNGDFSNSVIPYFPWTHPFFENRVGCWSCGHGSPQISFPTASPANFYARMWFGKNVNAGEGIVNNPPFNPLITGKTYLLEYLLRKEINSTGSAIVDNVYVKLVNSAISGLPPVNCCSLTPPGSNCNAQAIPALNGSVILDHVTNLSSTTFVKRTVCYTPTISGFDQLYIYPEQITTGTAWINVDDISLILVDDAGISQTIACGGSVQIGPTCPIPGAIYSWTGAGLSCYNCPNPIAAPNATTTYILTVTVPGGCTVNASVTITVPAININTVNNLSICNGDCTPISASATGGTASLTYSWSSPSGIICGPSVSPACSTINVCPIITTPYTFTVIDATGCTKTAVVTVSVNPKPTANAGPDKNICIGAPAGTIGGTPTASGGTAPYTYSWLPSAGLSCTNCANPTITLNTPGTYPYTVTVTDANGCTSTDQVIVTISPLPAAPVIIGNPNDCSPTSTYSIQNPVAGTTYNWQITNGSPATFTGPNLDITWNLANSQTAGTIVVTATNNSGCSASSTMYVYKCCTGDIYLNGQLVCSGCALNNTLATAAAASVQHPQFVGNAATGYSITGYSFNINGTFTIDANLTLIGCTMRVGPEGRILIKPGKTLTLQNNNSTQTILKAGCSVMWDGIYLEDNTAHLISTSTSANINRYTIIQDAKNAVVSTLGGDYQVNRTILEKNNTDIIVNAYSASNHTGTIKESILRTGTGTMLPYFTGNILRTALARTNTGIQLVRVSDIQIGDFSSAALGNLFDKMAYGIHAIGSKFRVYNNTFQNMISLTGNPVPVINGIGVYSQGVTNSPFALGITVGGAGLRTNTFTNTTAGAFMGYGVHVQNGIPAIDVLNNTFIRNNFSAIQVIGCQNGTININDNTILENPAAPSALFKAIDCINIYGSTTNIKRNTIRDLLASSSGNKNTTGISVQNPIATSMSLFIQNNTIQFHRTGIHLIGISGSASGTPIISNNDITMTPQPGSYTNAAKHYGIRMQQTSSIHVRQNTITKNGGNPNANMVQTAHGINLENSQNCTIGRDNTMTKMGAGIFISGNCILSRFVCNSMTRCYYGVFFDGQNVTTTLSDQIRLLPPINNTPIPTGNVWSNSMNADLGGKISTFPPINWYYNGAIPPSNNLAPLSLANNIPTFTSNTSLCALFFAPLPPPQQPALSSIIQNQNQYPALVNQNKAMERKFALKMLKANPQLLHSNTPDDILFQNFYSSIISSTLGKMVLVEDTLAEGNITEAITLNNAITDTCTIETNRKKVNNIYLNTWAQGILSFSPSDSAILYNIAIQEPLEFGDAVYSARIMLALDPVSFSNNRMMEDQQEDMNLNRQNNFSKIYPNPNNGIMQLDYKLNEGQSGEVIIFDIIGHKINSYPIMESEGGTIQITESLLENGIYFYEIKINGEIKSSDKIVIMK